MNVRISPEILRHWAFVVLLCLALVACGTGDDDEQDDDAAADARRADESDERELVDGDAEDEVDGAPDDDEPEEQEPEADPAEVDANELGEIPVLMYHRLLEDGGGVYDLTAEEFRAELEYLYEHDYRPIRTIDLVTGEIDVPAGTTPVVLTFDDSTREQFGYDEDGGVDPDTSVGILLDVADQYDDFDAVGSFYVTGSLFGVSDERGAEMLRDLHELGFEIGNHTLDHERLDHLDAAGVRRALAEGARNITEAVPDARVRTLSLPLGVWPDDRELAVRGRHDGYTYEHEGVLLVGSNPAPSPFHADFDPLAIPRIHSQHGESDGSPTYDSGFWLQVLEDDPGRRYVSDGDPETVSFPEELADGLAGEHRDRANPY